MKAGDEDKVNIARLPTANATSGPERDQVLSSSQRTEPVPPNDAAWIEAYIARAQEPIDFGPVIRRIKNHKLAAYDAEELISDQAVTKIAGQTAQYIPLQPKRNPWKDTENEQ